MPFQCTLVTPESQAFSDTVQQVILPAHDGLVGILSNRAPLLVKLGLGPLRIDLMNGQKLYYVLDGGVAQMKDNTLTIISNEATAADQIDTAAAQAEYAEAAAKVPSDEASRLERDHQMQRARARREVASRR